jgi:perosamine synthetase
VSTSFEPGAAPRGFIPLCVPSIQGNAWAYVKECLDTNWVSSVGPFVDRLEKMMTDYTGGRYAVATVNGTAALHIALLVAGVQPDDEVLVSTLTFIASANAIRYAGAWPVFIDAERNYWQMDPDRVQEFLEKQCRWQAGHLVNRTTGRRVSAIVPVHVLGHPVDMKRILELARKYNLRVIEDAAEALGASYENKRIGQWSDITCFSYNGNKIITTGGGGMLVTDNASYAAKARYLTTQAKDDPLEYIHNEMGYNYRLTNLQAALGCAQMEMLDQFVTTKRRIAARYRDAVLDRPGLTAMQEAPWAFSTFWLFTMLVDQKQLGLTSRDLLRRLAEKQIQSRPLWQPMHRSPSFASLPPVRCPVADALCRDAVSLPCSVGLSIDDQQQVIDTIVRVISRESRQAA